MTRWQAFRYSLGAPFRALYDLDGRRAWAIILMAGGGIAMTLYACAVLWIVKDHPNYAFYLGAGALLLVAIILTGFASLVTKRDIDINALGVKFRVSDQQVQDIASAVVAATPPAPPPVVVMPTPVKEN